MSTIVDPEQEPEPTEEPEEPTDDAEQQTIASSSMANTIDNNTASDVHMASAVAGGMLETYIHQS